MSFAYLSESDRERLRQLPFPVALPQELPSGWSIQPFDIYTDPDDGDTSLEVPFQGPQSARWSVLTTDGGLGDVLPGETDHSHRLIQSDVFGQILIHSFTEEEVPEVASDWFPEEEGASFYHAFRGANVSVEDLRALVDSLELLEAS